MRDTRYEALNMIRVAHKLIARGGCRSDSRKKEMDSAALKLLNRATRFLSLDECDQGSTALFSHDSFIREATARRLSSLASRAL